MDQHRCPGPMGIRPSPGLTIDPVVFLYDTDTIRQGLGGIIGVDDSNVSGTEAFGLTSISHSRVVLNGLSGSRAMRGWPTAPDHHQESRPALHKQSLTADPSSPLSLASIQLALSM